MMINVLSYDTLGELVTVELRATGVGPDGLETPLKFMGRTEQRAIDQGAGTLPERIYQISQILGQMAMDLVGDPEV